nr:U-scoloptoxin(16)-Er13a [Biomphalaria glabrata]
MFAGLTVSYAAVIVMMDQCQDGHKMGETWYLANCEQCVCWNDYYYCESCGIYTMVYDHSTCYTKTNDTANYPECCTPHLYCEGDADFNPANLNLENPAQWERISAH